MINPVNNKAFLSGSVAKEEILKKIFLLRRHYRMKVFMFLKRESQ